MFIRKTTTKKYAKTGTAHTTYRLVSTYRNAHGKVKQETLLNLGSNFSIPEEQWRLLTDRIEQLLSCTGLLFKLEVPLEIEKEANRIVKLLSAKKTDASAINQHSFPTYEEGDYQNVDINSLNTSEVKHVGSEHVAYHAATQLNLKKVLSDAGLNSKQVSIALASIISRLIRPGSERAAHKYLTQDSALDELMSTDFSDLDIRQLYKVSDLLWGHKAVIEDALYQREKELFNLQEIITLFDITNTYFEGSPNHTQAAKGRSKEKRSDCELVSLGLLLDSSGFPKKSKILPGNISEPSTLEEMIEDLNPNSGTIVIMDAGIATKDNIMYLKEHNFNYIVVKRDLDLVMPENDKIIVKDTKSNQVTVSLIQAKEEINLYCHSTAKELKSIEFNTKMCKRFEEELTKLNNNLPACNLTTEIKEYSNQSCAIILANNKVFSNRPNELITLIIKSNQDTSIAEFKEDSELSELLASDKQMLELCTKYTGQEKIHSKLQTKLRNLFAHRVQQTKKGVIREYEKVAIKLGRLKQQFKHVSYLYDITIKHNPGKTYAAAIQFNKNNDLTLQKNSGIYCLTTNVKNLSAQSLWQTYTTLTEIEAAFRSLKSELGMRPVYHQLENRIDGHIFISILAYHLLHTIRYQLKSANICSNWSTIRDILALQIRSTTSLNLKDGGIVRVRQTSQATPEQAVIYKALGISSKPGKINKTYIRHATTCSASPL